MLFSIKNFALAAALVVGAVNAESHRIQQVNNCGRGTPIISQNFNHLSPATDYTAQGAFSSWIAWLDTGGCDFEGTGCGIVEGTLLNGGISSVDISLINDHYYQTPIRFEYTTACSGYGASCSSADCPATDAFHKTDDYGAQRQCSSGDNAGIIITYC